MHTLIIKGDETVAFKACDTRKLEIIGLQHRPQFNDTFVTIPDGLPTLTVLVDWFCEPADRPYPDGTLLWYGPARLPMPDNATQFGHVVPKGWDKAETATEDSQ